MADASLRLAWRVFAEPKGGLRPEEYEDACAGDPAAGRFAVADGASESAFAGTWANLLVENYVRVSGPWSSWLPAARRCWEEKNERHDMPWYLEAKFAEGAFATLLGVAFLDRSHWQAAAVGDSCLFQIRGDRLRRGFPIRSSEDFGNQPALLCSRATPGGRKTRRFRLRSAWRKGDKLLLATDALAQWFLREVEAGREPWKELVGLETAEQFGSWVQQVREGKQIRNDDVTLGVIESAPR